MTSQPQLVIAYNAQAGIVAGVMDSIHKTVSPETYACDLCALTHGLLTMRPTWRQWLRELPIEVSVFHKPDFAEAFPASNDVALPLVGIARGAELTVMLSANEIGTFKDIDSLVAELKARLTPALSDLQLGRGA